MNPKRSGCALSSPHLPATLKDEESGAVLASIGLPYSGRLTELSVEPLGYLLWDVVQSGG